MAELSPQKCAGEMLRKLIAESYPTQEEFAYDYGTDIRTVSRYINNGINKIDIVQELAAFFHVDFMDFFKQPSA